MNQIVIKPATSSDIPVIKNIYDDARSFGKLSGSCDWSDDYPNEVIINDDINNRNLSLVFLDSKPIAVFSLIEHDDLDNEPLNWTPCKAGIPVRICIKSQHQGKGLGIIIMEELIKIAINKGYKSLRLLASTSNKPANKLYKSLKFVHKGVVNLYQKEFNAYELLI